MNKRNNAAMMVAGCLMCSTLVTMGQNAPAEAVKPTAPEKAPVLVGTGNLTVSGLLQGWYQFTDGEKVEDTFRLRRAEVKLSGEITPSVPWAVMIDPAQVREDDTKSASIGGTNFITSVGRKSPLQDFFITLKLHSSSSLDIGQYKTPFGMEGLTSSAKLDLIERAMLASSLKWADYRDVGVTYKGSFTCPMTGAKVMPTLGVYNGEGQNKLDANDPMAYAARLAVEPVKNVHLGVAYYNGETGSAETENNRIGAELKVTAGSISVYGEYATGEVAGKDIETYYATVAANLGESIQAVVRYDMLDPNTDTDDDAKTESTIGVNYFIKKHNAKLAVNYVVRGEEGVSVDNDIVRAMAQISF